MQGRSVLPYALSELIDNALMATKANQASRQVVITLALSGGSNPQSGLIAVWDNGEACQKRGFIAFHEAALVLLLSCCAELVRSSR